MFTAKKKTFDIIIDFHLHKRLWAWKSRKIRHPWSSAPQISTQIRASHPDQRSLHPWQQWNPGETAGATVELEGVKLVTIITQQYLTQLWKIIIDITDFPATAKAADVRNSLSIEKGLPANYSLRTASMSRSQARTIRRMWFTSPLLFPQVTRKSIKYSPTLPVPGSLLGNTFYFYPTLKRT